MNSSRSFTVRPFPMLSHFYAKSSGGERKDSKKNGARRHTILVALALEPLKQPSPSIGPQQVGGARRNAQGLGRLLAGQTGEKAQLDQRRGLGVCLGQLVQ